jgi:hypothetical protein
MIASCAIIPERIRGRWAVCHGLSGSHDLVIVATR